MKFYMYNIGNNYYTNVFKIESNRLIKLKINDQFDPFGQEN